MKRLLTYLFLALGFGLIFTNSASALPECEGTDYSKWTNCQGTVAEDGYKYIGEWKNGEFHGQGTASGAEYIYIGEWKDGEQHGQGTYTWPTGEKYVGEFKDGKRYGRWKKSKITGENKKIEKTSKEYVIDEESMKRIDNFIEKYLIQN